MTFNPQLALLAQVYWQTQNFPYFNLYPLPVNPLTNNPFTFSQFVQPQALSTPASLNLQGRISPPPAAASSAVPASAVAALSQPLMAKNASEVVLATVVAEPTDLGEDDAKEPHTPVLTRTASYDLTRSQSLTNAMNAASAPFSFLIPEFAAVSPGAAKKLMRTQSLGLNRASSDVRTTSSAFAIFGQSTTIPINNPDAILVLSRQNSAQLPHQNPASLNRMPSFATSELPPLFQSVQDSDEHDDDNSLESFTDHEAPIESTMSTSPLTSERSQSTTSTDTTSSERRRSGRRTTPNCRLKDFE